MTRTNPGPTFSLGVNTFSPREEGFASAGDPLTATVDRVERMVTPGMTPTVAPGALFALRDTAECPRSVLACTSAGISAELHGQVFVPP